MPRKVELRDGVGPEFRRPQLHRSQNSASALNCRFFAMPPRRAQDILMPLS
jgi:hypothetical protein